MTKLSKKPPLSLGDYIPSKHTFPNLQDVFAEFNKPEFGKLPARKRFRRINEALAKLILDAPTPSFLLPAVVDFIDRINKEEILHDRYHISAFEFWLNHFSELKDDQNYLIRGKIMGKYIPRGEYQAFFPIGMNQVFSGTHFVAAHLSPDVDTMVASFWGWVDAFAARVGDARHLWNLPGGPPDSPVTHIFQEMFGQSIFSNTARIAMTLTLSAMDLVTQKGFLKKKASSSISDFDISSTERAVILVDSNGSYQGEWHRSDTEPVRQIIIRFKSCLRWFENNLHVKLISLFAKNDLYVKDLTNFYSSVFDITISDCEPAKEFTERQKHDLDAFFHKVLGMEKGLHSTFRELNQALGRLSVYELIRFQEEVEALSQSDLFDRQGNLKEDRPAIFERLQKIINQLDNAIHFVRDYAEQLDVAMKIKSKVLGLPSQYITIRNDVEDIRIKLQQQEYITVVIQEDNDKLFPVGIVWANTLQKKILGTVTFRDFCNEEEVKMAPYLSPISVVDHHKSTLKTSSPPMAIIGDAQSSNVLIAEITFGINERYSQGGMTSDQIDQEILRLRDESFDSSNMRLLQGLLQKKSATHHAKEYFVHPDREIAEYLSFLHAILDDTDLLTKVSKRDVECVTKLLNRIKSLILQKDVEVVNLDDIPRDQGFAKAAAKRLLRNPELYSLYRKIYESKEQEIERNLEECIEGRYEPLFVDTKEQNGCCRVGQTKLFSVNFPTFEKKVPLLIEYWVKTAEQVYKKHPEIDLHMHMISTVSSANEVYEEKKEGYKHQDQVWFWVPPLQKGFDHLSSFLTAFQAAHKFGENASLQFLKEDRELVSIFARNCPEIPHIKSKLDLELPVVILRFPAGFLNSRKAMVTPYLPRII